jgi:hypothetical protein
MEGVNRNNVYKNLHTLTLLQVLDTHWPPKADKNPDLFVAKFTIRPPELDPSLSPQGVMLRTNFQIYSNIIWYICVYLIT